jgi:hypothetical protein
MLLNCYDALRMAQALSFPRLPGSEGEERAASFIEKKLREFGYHPQRERFLVPLTPWGPMRISVLLAILVLIGARVLATVTPLASGILMVLAVAFLAFYSSLWLKLAGSEFLLRLSNRRRKKERSIWSHNLTAKLPAREQPDRSLYLVAHYDSKSQNLSILHRAFFLLLAVLSFLWLAICYARSLGEPLGLTPSWGVELPIAIGLLALIAIFMIRTANRSPGALDNAAAAGVLLQLADTLRKNPPKRSEVIFLFTGAEELGAHGAFAYLKRHGNEIQKKNAYFLNLDGVGIKGATRIFSRKGALPLGDPTFLALCLQDLGQSFGIKPMGFSLGILMDHHAFLEKGYQAASLACVSRKALAIHTPLDTPDLIEQDGLAEVANFILVWIQKMEYK